MGVTDPENQVQRRESNGLKESATWNATHLIWYEEERISLTNSSKTGSA